MKWIKSLAVNVVVGIGSLSATAGYAELGYPEKEERRIGLIKLTGMAPIA